MADLRLFIGLEVPPETGRRIERSLRPLIEGDEVRTYSADDMHVTLVFLGSWPEERLPGLKSALQEEVRGLNAPDLTIAGTGAFPDFENPRVLWAAVEEEEESMPGRLFALHNRVRQAALMLGWRPSAAERMRPFTPHVTVARTKAGDPGAAYRRLRFDRSWLPVEVLLVESRPGDPVERYRTLQALPLVVRPG